MDWFSGITVAKDPDAVLTWQWDWSDWLGTGDSISTHLVTEASGITVDSSSINGTDKVDVTLSGGSAGSSYTVAVKITTVAGLVDERTVTFEVGER
jgi:hypothetical protein